MISEKINAVLGHRDHGHIVEEGKQDDIQGVQGAVKYIDQNTSVEPWLKNLLIVSYQDSYPPVKQHGYGKWMRMAIETMIYHDLPS